MPDPTRGGVRDMTLDKFFVQLGEGYVERLVATHEELVPQLDHSLQEETTALMVELERFRQNALAASR
jgi:hypothetical protein